VVTLQERGNQQAIFTPALDTVTQYVGDSVGLVAVAGKVTSFHNG
jgi:hypothetical protein